MPAHQEIWQVEVGGQLYTADFGELAAWVADGALQPDDKVRRGDLRWIEARKVPTLVPHFNAKRDGSAPPPVVVSVTNASKKQVASGSDTVTPAIQPPIGKVAQATAIPPQLPLSFANDVRDPEFCINHRDIPTAYICKACSNTFCKGCPSSYGGSVKICPTCGGLCNPKEQVKAAKQAAVALQAASDEGFGFSDLATAIAYPLRFKTSFFFGSLMYMFFSLGQSASALGGIFMFVAAIFSLMLANMLTFGILAHTTEDFSQGNIGGDFMPRFDDFSMWDDVIHPFFLSLGAYISSFGPFVLVVIIGSYLVFSSVAEQQQNMMSEVEKLPGTEYYKGKQTLQQSEEVKKLLADAKKQNDERLQRITDGERAAETGQEPANTPITPVTTTDPNERLQQLATNRSAPIATTNPDDTADRAQQLIDQQRKAQLESAFGKTPETRAKEQSELVARFLSLAAPLVIFAVITLLWGLFYFPAACTVAGYTRSFVDAINPLVGLDTIRRLGFSYIKLLFMGFLLLIASGVVAMFLGLILSPFDLPGFGNIPAKVVGSFVSFYLWIVFSCLIGFLLFKSADKLKLSR